jgi:hypothetical protein
MGCAFLSPSLSSYRFNFFDPQKSERPWEPITNAVVVSEYGHLWRKKNTRHQHQPVTEITHVEPVISSPRIFWFKGTSPASLSLVVRDLAKCGIVTFV